MSENPFDVFKRIFKPMTPEEWENAKNNPGVYEHVEYAASLPAQSWWRGEMPNSWRTALLSYLPGATVMLVEAVHRCALVGLIDPNSFTLQQLTDSAPIVGFDLSYGTAARLINEVGEMFFVQIENSDLKNTVGRPPRYYKMRAWSDVYLSLIERIKVQASSREYNKFRVWLIDCYSSPMLSDIAKTPRDYRILYIRALVGSNRQIKTTRKNIAFWLGVSQQNVTQYKHILQA